MSAADSQDARRVTTLAAYRGPQGSKSDLAPSEHAPCPPCAQGPDIDARVDLHLFAHRVRTALRDRGTAAARARLAKLADPALWTGVVQDGTYRGLMVALEEAEQMCRPATDSQPTSDRLVDDHELASGRSRVFTGKDLRKQREFVVASDGARVRFSRRHGLLLVDRRIDLHAEDCLHFEDQADAGDLDRFKPAGRPRYFRPAFLRPERFAQTPTTQELVLAGRLGRKPDGMPCRIELFGHKDRTAIRLRIAVHNQHENHRLRIRFHSVPGAALDTGGSPGVREVRTPGGREFVAATLARSVGTLRVENQDIATPAAQCIGWLHHEFWLGAHELS